MPSKPAPRLGQTQIAATETNGSLIVTGAILELTIILALPGSVLLIIVNFMAGPMSYSTVLSVLQETIVSKMAWLKLIASSQSTAMATELKRLQRVQLPNQKR